MVFNPTIVAAIAAAAVGFAAYWANPQRGANRAVLTGSLHVAIWLGSLHLAFRSQDGLFGLKLACSVGAFLPLHILIIQQTLSARLGKGVRSWLGNHWIWVGVSCGLAIIPFTNVFIPSHSTSERRLIGWGYYGYIGIDVALYGLLFRDGIRAVKSSFGVRRLELQLWLLGGCIIAVAILVLMVLNSATHNPIFIRLQPLIVLLFYAGTTFAITTHRIFDARQIVLLAMEKGMLIATVAAFAYFCDLALRWLMPQPFDFVATTAVALWFAVTMNAWLDRLFQFYPQATTARQAAFTIAQREMRLENLDREFRSVLSGWGQSEKTIILTGTRDMLTGDGIELAGDSFVLRAMRQLRWATPERITRERTTVERQALNEFLTNEGLGVVVIENGPAYTVLIGVGVAASRRPFTYPQVAQLMELATIMESALERAHFSAKVQHTEQLATVGLLGASLAHEIRNPLVSIKTFVQLLPTHHQDPVFREKFFRLIGDEVGRIDQLTEQLLDLASPRTYAAQMIELHPVLRASLDLVAAKAAHKNIQFLTDFQAEPDRAYTDASAAKQVMLNLCFNAIQAAESKDGDERWVKIGTRNTPTGIEMAVADSGPGVAEEIRPRLFQPFQTTKSTGFGLGLAICSDILANLNASISVDPPMPGRGATFRVTFPCQPLSS